MKKNITEQFSLDKLNKIANGDEDFVREMIVLFLEKAPESLQIIINSGQSKDYAKLASQAHKMKSSLQIIANQKIHEIIKEVETQANQGDEKKVALVIKELEKQMELLFKYLKTQT